VIKFKRKICTTECNRHVTDELTLLNIFEKVGHKRRFLRLH